jgi:cell wall-associated NlpC family hydrolase
VATPIAHFARPSARLSRVRAAQLVVAVGACTAVSLALLPGVGMADPKPTIAEVQARVDALQDQADIAAEDVQEATLQRDALAKKAQAAQAEVAARQAALDASRAQLGKLAAASYRSGSPVNGLALVMSSDSAQSYLTRSADLQHLQQARTDQISAVQADKVRVAEASVQVEKDLAAQKAVEDTVAAKQKAIQDSLNQQQALLNQLTAEQKAQLAAAKAAREAAALKAAQAQAAAARASRARAAQPQATYAGPASGRAAAAVQMAYAQLGKPYHYGAGGASSFDCSGLTSFAWRAAGVALPHSSRAQYASGRKVAQSDLQPGDLVYFGRPIHHVGIYIGNGQMINAPQTGELVRVQAAFRSDYVGATRP